MLDMASLHCLLGRHDRGCWQIRTENGHDGGAQNLQVVEVRQLNYFYSAGRYDTEIHFWHHQLQHLQALTDDNPCHLQQRRAMHAA